MMSCSLLVNIYLIELKRTIKSPENLAPYLNLPYIIDLIQVGNNVHETTKFYCYIVKLMFLSFITLSTFEFFHLVSSSVATFVGMFPFKDN